MVPNKRFSEMTANELHSEISMMVEKARKAEQLGIVNELAVWERRIALAKAYLLDPNDIEINKGYKIEGDESTIFHVHYLNGVFAWGVRKPGNNEEEGIPISLLKQ